MTPPPDRDMSPKSRVFYALTRIFMLTDNTGLILAIMYFLNFTGAACALCVRFDVIPRGVRLIIT